MSVPVELMGDCVGVREGGRIDFITRELEIEILPREMFDKIESTSASSTSVTTSRLVILPTAPPESAKFLEDENRVIVLVEATRRVEERGRRGRGARGSW